VIDWKRYKQPDTSAHASLVSGRSTMQNKAGCGCYKAGEAP
jgi:hypothetical protein